MNQGLFSGRIGRDGSLASVNNDVVCNFSLAVEIGSKAKPRTQWVECSIWGKRAESLASYLSKGTKVFVMGRVWADEYQAKDGTMRSRLNLNVSELDFSSSRNDQGQEKQETKPGANVPAHEYDMPQDDIPF